MYVPRADAPLSDVECWDVGRAAGCGELVATGVGGELRAAVPTQYVVEGRAGEATGIRVLVHLARRNPLWEAIAQRPLAVLAVAGDWAFVPGGWKAIGPEDPGAGLPTTYYAAVQVEAEAQVVEDPHDLLDLLRGQTAGLAPRPPDASH